jgi:hypothetical protein
MCASPMLLLTGVLSDTKGKRLMYERLLRSYIIRNKELARKHNG